jgi:hypothetical protein
MRVVFVYKGRYQIRDANIIECLSSMAAAAGHETSLVYDPDLFGVTDNVLSCGFLSRMASRDGLTRRKLLDEKPDAAVFLNGFNRVDWNIGMARFLKHERPQAKSVFLSYWGERQQEVYDYALIGEPEFVFGKFLEDRLYGHDSGVYKLDGLADLDSLPLPDKSLFKDFVDFGRSYLIYTSKGCPYRCSYCEETVYKRKTGEGYFRRKSPESVLRELKKAKRDFGIREVIFKDSVFAYDRDWMMAFLRGYAKEIAAPFKCFGRAESFDGSTASLLKRSGCYCVEFGAQTFKEGLKKKVLNRNEPTDRLLSAFEACAEERLFFDVDHMFGIPGESIEDHRLAGGIYAGLKYLNRIKCHNLTFYRQAEIYECAPSSVKESADYNADFFSQISGEKEMRVANKAFQRLFKVLPLMPERFGRALLKNGRWKVLRFFPGFLTVFFMSMIALRNKDRRFLVYLKEYPRKISRGLFRR